jgi:raffinose/stachyose/melibiose transport system permease protein
MPTSNTTTVGAVAAAAAPTGGVRLRPGFVRARRREALNDLAMLAPALILVGGLIIVPIFIALYLSFTNWDGFTLPAQLIGPRNYIHLVQDPAVIRSAGVTLLITAIGAIACNVLGLALALFLNRNTRLNAFLRVLVFYPYVVGPIILGFLWSSILGTNGAINGVLGSLKLGSLPFLSDPTWAMVTLISIIVWSSFGVNVVLYLAGLQTVPESLIEAAIIDGATPWQVFWRVKLPLLAPTVTLNVVLTVIGLLRVFELILALTKGGPAGTTQSVVYSILTSSFQNYQLGYGAAQSIVLMVVIVVVTVGITVARRRSEQAVAA